jgi:gluconate kinase
MPTSLLPSQFQTLEPLADAEDGVVVPVEVSPHSVADAALRELGIDPATARTGASPSTTLQES